MKICHWRFSFSRSTNEIFIAIKRWADGQSAIYGLKVCFWKCQSCLNWSHQIRIRNGYIYMGSFNLSVMSLFYGLFKSDILLHLAKSINHFLEYLETDSVPDFTEEILTFLTITCHISLWLMLIQVPNHWSIHWSIHWSNHWSNHWSVSTISNMKLEMGNINMGPQVPDLFGGTVPRRSQSRTCPLLNTMGFYWTSLLQDHLSEPNWSPVWTGYF